MEKKTTKKKSNAGRPTIMTEAVIGKLESVFAMDGSIREACYFAGINPDTYFEFMKKNPEYTERFDALRNRPVLLARQTVMKKLTENYSNAMDYLSRKAKKEFSVRQEITGANGEAILQPTLTEAEKDKLLALLKKK